MPFKISKTFSVSQRTDDGIDLGREDVTRDIYFDISSISISREGTGNASITACIDGGTPNLVDIFEFQYTVSSSEGLFDQALKAIMASSKYSSSELV
ncbi:hypothetical protein ACYCW3_000783 [Klebsiella quasipneumoniae]